MNFFYANLIKKVADKQELFFPEPKKATHINKISDKQQKLAFLSQLNLITNVIDMHDKLRLLDLHLRLTLNNEI